MSNSNGNLVLGGYSVEDIQSMVAILLASGKIAVGKGQSERITNSDFALEIANTAARWGVHPLAMSNMIVQGRLVTVPPMDAMYSWERQNGGIMRSEFLYFDVEIVEYKKKVKAISVAVWGVRNDDITHFQKAYETNLALFSNLANPDEGVAGMQKIIGLAKLEAFKMHGVKGEGVASINELGRVKGRSTNFVAEKRANSDLIIKCFGRPAPVDIARRFADVRAQLNAPSTYAELPQDWTVEQKQIASNIQQSHNEFVALPRDEQRERVQNNRRILQGDVDPILEDPYAEQPKYPTRENLLKWLENLNQLPEVNGYFKDPKHVQNSIRLEWPVLSDKEAWAELKQSAINHADFGNYKKRLKDMDLPEDTKQAMLELFEQDSDTAWEALNNMAE